MRLVSSWIREFVNVPVDDRRFAADLTMAGIAIDSVEQAENGETVLEADVTTNRPDAMNHYGVAREASAIYDTDLKPYCSDPQESEAAAAKLASVEIADADLCARYSARVISGVKVGPSPDWMVRRLEAAGLRSINNVADVTNYLLLETGQPLHAFDLETLAGRKIIVRRARAGETLTTLDGVVRTFNPDNLVIADAERPVAIAGVMGGADTGIGEKTATVLLESAWFEPRSIRRTARQLGMHTDASHRFERGADVNITGVAADRAAELIRAVAGGQILRGLIDAFPAPRPRPTLVLRREEISRILGEEIPPADVERILRRLGFRVASDAAGQWMLQPPSFRLDIERDIDVIEELARLYGYDRFPNRLPAWAGIARREPSWEAGQTVRRTTLALGYNETMSFTLIAPRDAEAFSDLPAVRLSNPLSEEASVMRTSMAPGMLNAIEWNLNRGAHSVRLFEVGKVYLDLGGRYEERDMLGLGGAGLVSEPSPHASERAFGFFDLKGDVEALLERFEYTHLYFDANVGVEYYHPGRAARAAMGGETVARFGELHPRLAAARKFRQPVFVAEIFLHRLLRRGLRRPRYSPPPRVPAVERDLSLLVPEKVAFERVADVARKAGVPEMVAIHAVEKLVGGPVPAGSYGLLLRLVFQHPERTLSDAEVNEWSRQVASALQRDLSITQRT